MFKEIASCQKCTLQLCQKPLLDKLKKGAVMVVGVSAKQIHANSEIPLDNSTRSGQLVSSMEKIAMQYELEIYRTNLVKCPPLDEKCKLRYPFKNEIDKCFDNILYEIHEIQPPIVILLGKIVQSAFEEKIDLNFEPVRNCEFPFQKKHGLYYVASYHPSYVMRSKQLQNQYLKNFESLLHSLPLREPQCGLIGKAELTYN